MPFTSLRKRPMDMQGGIGKVHETFIGCVAPRR